jgi:hypothetical protein
VRVEVLENRLAPAVFWTGAGDGVNWTDARNWNTGSLPTAADDVVIATDPSITIQHAFPAGNDSIHSLQSQNALNISSGSLTIADASEIDNTLTLSNALVTVTVNGDLNVQDLVQTSGNFTGTGNVEISDQWVWSSGNVSGTGHIVLDSTAQGTLSGGFFSMLIGRTVDNWGSATAVDGGFDFQGNAVWNNRSGSAFVLQDGAALGNFFAGTTAQFNNHGVLALEDGPGTSSSIGIPLVNAGEVDVDVGTLTLSGGGSSRGSFHLEDGTVLNIASNYTLNARTIVSGPGTVQVTIFDTLQIAGNLHVPNLTVSGGTVTTNGNLTLDTLTENGGTVGGPGTLTINGQWTWTNGNMTGPGRTVLNGAGTLSGGFFSMLMGRTVDNRGNVTTMDGGFDFEGDAVWNNRFGSTFVLQDAASLGNFFAGPGAAFNNAGLLDKEGSGTSTIDIPLNNTGTLYINSSSVLRVNRPFTQGPFGSLQIELGGSDAGSGFGQLAVTGQATLDGNLTVILVNDFTPSQGDRFSILTFGSRGSPPTDFATKDLPAGLNAVYSSSSLTLVAS